MTKPNVTMTVALPLSAGVIPSTAATRQMTRADIDSLVDLWLASYQPDVSDGATPEEVQADWTAAFDGDYGRLLPEASLVVEEEGQMIAAVQTVVDAVWDRTPRGPFIIELLVHPAARRRGLARHLMVSALSNLDTTGFTSVSLRVESDNAAAKGLYTSLGFRSVAPQH